MKLRLGMNIRHSFLIFNAIIFFNNLNGQPQKLYSFDKNPQVIIKNSPIDLSGLKLQPKYFSTKNDYKDSIKGIWIEITVIPSNGEICVGRNIQYNRIEKNEIMQMNMYGQNIISSYYSYDKVGNFVCTSFYRAKKGSDKNFVVMIKRGKFSNMYVRFEIWVKNIDILEFINKYSNIDVVLK